MSSRHFLTIAGKFPLPAALALSLLLHLLPFLPRDIFEQKKPSTAVKLQASLLPPPLVPEQPPLHLPEPEKKKASAEKPRPLDKQPAAPGKTSWMQSVREQFRKQDAAGQFYPAEAIARGLQGEVLVLFYLNEEGHVVAARIEQGSGHAILDEAALRAVRALRTLPADAPRESILPVKFRLH